MDFKKRGEKLKPPAYKKKKNENRFGMFMAIVTIFIVAVAVGYNSYSLREKQAAYKQEIAELESQIQDEEDRTKELEDLKDYMGTKQYVEEVAKDKLGLVYDNEIIFKKDDK